MTKAPIHSIGAAGTYGRYVKPIAVGLLIAVGALLPFLLLSQWNASLRPDIPWAALVTLTYLAILLAWLNGAGPPARTRMSRRLHLRLWPRQASREDRGSIILIVAGLGMLTLLWIMIGRQGTIPDLDAYRTTSYRWSMFIMGGFTAGFIEEVAFRGYMQSGIERFDEANAIWITSLVFVALHITQGLGTVLLLGPGLFAASMLYGMLARKTGSILPGMLIHVLGDLSHTYFGVLRGNASLLFVGN